MATSANARSVSLVIEAGVTGQEAIRRLTDEIRSLGREGGDAAPEFAALEQQLNALGEQAGAVAALQALTAEVKALAAEQTVAAERARQVGEAFDQQKAAVAGLRETQATARAAYDETALSLDRTRNALASLRGGLLQEGETEDAAAKRKLELIAAVEKLRNAQTEQSVAVKAATSAVQAATSVENKLATEYDRASTAAARAADALRARNEALRGSEAAAAAAGASTSDLVAAEQALLGSTQQVAAEARRLVEARELQAAADRAAIATAEELDAQNKALADSLASRLQANAAAYERDEAALRQVAAAQQAAADDALRFVLALEREETAASAAAAELAELNTKARQLKESEKYVLELAAALDKADAEAKATAASLQKFATDTASAGRVLNEAFGQTGVRSLQAIEAEIARVDGALGTLERAYRAGTVSADDLARATSSAAVRVSTLTRELNTIPALPGALESINTTITSLIGRFGALTAAVATVGFAVKPILDVVIQLDTLRRTLTTVTGSTTVAAEQIEFLRATAQRSGQSFNDIATSYGKFAASALKSGLDLRTTEQVFNSVALAAGNLGLSSDQAQRALEALSQMASKGVVSMEELRQQLGDALPGVLPLLAKELGVTQQQLGKLIESGQLLATDAIPAIGRSLVELGPKGGAPVEGIVASFNRLKNVAAEAIAVVSQGALGAAAGAAFAALAFAIERVIFGITVIGESFTVVGKQIGTVIAAVVSRDFKNLNNALAEIERESAEKLGALANRIAGAGGAAVTTGSQFKGAAGQVQAAVAALDSSATAADHSATSHQALAPAVTQAGTAAAAAGNNWVALSVQYGLAIANAEKAAKIAEKLAEAKKTEGEAMAATIAISGDEIAARGASAVAAQNYATALDAQARADAVVVETLTAQRDALAKVAAETGRTDEATKNALKTLQQTIDAKGAEAEKSRQSAEAARTEAAARSVAAESLKDNTSRYVEFRDAVDKAETALRSVIERFGRDKATTDDVRVATLELAKAKGLLRDAINDTAKASERSVATLKADAEITKQQLQLDLQKAKNDEARLRALGLESAARQAGVKIAEIELAIEKQATAAKRAEADETIRGTKEQLEELRVKGLLTPELENELTLRVKGAQAKKVEAETETEATKVKAAAVDALKNHTTSIYDNSKASDENTGSQDRNTTSRTSNAGAIEKQTTAQERYNRLLRDDPTRLVGGSGLGGFNGQAGATPLTGVRNAGGQDNKLAADGGKNFSVLGPSGAPGLNLNGSAAGGFLPLTTGANGQLIPLDPSQRTVKPNTGTGAFGGAGGSTTAANEQAVQIAFDNAGHAGEIGRDEIQVAQLQAQQAMAARYPAGGFGDASALAEQIKALAAEIAALRALPTAQLVGTVKAGTPDTETLKPDGTFEIKFTLGTKQFVTYSKDRSTAEDLVSALEQFYQLAGGH